MSIPGFNADASLRGGSHDKPYRTVFAGGASATLGVEPQYLLYPNRPSYCRGCWLCSGDNPVLCSCEYPCPIDQFPLGAWSSSTR
jgi:hypothetical protein